MSKLSWQKQSHPTAKHYESTYGYFSIWKGRHESLYRLQGLGLDCHRYRMLAEAKEAAEEVMNQLAEEMRSNPELVAIETMRLCEIAKHVKSINVSKIKPSDFIYAGRSSGSPAASLEPSARRLFEGQPTEPKRP